MMHRSRAARPAAQAGGPGASAEAAAGAGSGADAPPPSGSRWPSSALVRWEGPRDVWDILPFPPQGPGVLGLLRDAVARCSLFRGRRGEEPSLVLSLSVVLSAGGASRTLPLKNDEDVEKAVLLWLRYPGTAEIIDVTTREEGVAANLGGGAEVPWDPPLCGSRPPRPAPIAAAALGNSFPVDAWACVFAAVACSRCVEILCVPPSPIPCRHPFTLTLCASVCRLSSRSLFMRDQCPLQGRRRACPRVRQRRGGVQGGTLAPHHTHEA